VQIGLNIHMPSSFRPKIGNIVIDNHVDLLNIDTSGDDVGCDEDLRLTVSKAIQYTVPLIMDLVRVERGYGVAIFGQPRRNFVRGVFPLRSVKLEALPTLQNTILWPIDMQS
jgi:hypothetical protein